MIDNNNLRNYYHPYQRQYLNNNSINRSLNNLSKSINPNPYGITFENEKDFKQIEKNKYKEDLDYLVWLKQGRKIDSDNTKAKEQYESKLYLEQQQQISESYLKENKNYQNQLMLMQKNLINNNELKRKYDKEQELLREKDELSLLNQQPNETNKLKQQKDKWNNIAKEEYDNYLHKQYEKNRLRQEEDENNLKLQEEKNKRDLMRSKEYQDMMNNKNNQIYKNLINYSGYLANNKLQSSNEPYHLMNDNELNKYIADQRERERLALRKDNSANLELESMKNMLINEERNNKENKFNTQKAYKEYLDKQYHELQNQKQPIKTPFSGDLMPSYKYPNLPVPLYKKAKDSIHLVKNNILFENQNVGDMKEFFTHDIQNHTLLDQNEKRFNYYNGTSLLNNPITNPQDHKQNKYINSSLLKNQDENNLAKSYNPNSRRSLINNNSNSQNALIKTDTNNYYNGQGFNNIRSNNNNSINNMSNEYYKTNALSNSVRDIPNLSQNQPQNQPQNQIIKNSNFNQFQEQNKKIRTPHNDFNYSHNNDQSSPNYYYNPNHHEIINSQQNNINPNLLNNDNSKNVNDYTPFNKKEYELNYYNMNNSAKINNSNINNNSNSNNNNSFRLKSTNLNNNTKLMQSSKENSYIQRFRDRLKVKGILGVFKLRQYCENIDTSNTFMLDFNQFNSMCKEFYMGFNYEDSRNLFSYLDDTKIGKIKYEEFITAVIGQMPEHRRVLVNNLYDRLSEVFQDKYVEELTVKSKFDAQRHPDVMSHFKNTNEVLVEFMNDFNLFFHKARVSDIMRLLIFLHILILLLF